MAGMDFDKLVDYMAMSRFTAHESEQAQRDRDATANARRDHGAHSTIMAEQGRTTIEESYGQAQAKHYLAAEGANLGAVGIFDKLASLWPSIQPAPPGIPAGMKLVPA